MCGFVKLSLRGGEGAEIRLLYSECYEYENAKGDRTDAENGMLRGYTDFYRVTEAFFEKDHASEESAKGNN